MRTLKESLLSDIDSQLDYGNVAVDNLDTLPTINDFTRNIYNHKWHEATWYCPNVLDMYRSKYSDLIPKESDSISIVIDATYGRVMDCNIYFTTGKGTKGMTQRKRHISGWDDGLVGANLKVYKKMAISILNGLAHNHDKLEELFKYSTEYRKVMNNEDEDFHHRAAKFPIKSLLKLIEK